MKSELTRAAENDMSWERKEYFIAQHDNDQEVKGKNGDKREMREDQTVTKSQLFKHSLPRLKLPKFSGSVEDWPRWYSLFSAMVDKQGTQAQQENRWNDVRWKCSEVAPGRPAAGSGRRRCRARPLIGRRL